ncbi:L,D-transpeptidase [Lacipirellula sp.]|uniref:L,D-transpeptidase n=1 Tax=Lacipirellula sp. TaxID=2691419 RepID=UPI003D1476C3
MTSKHSLAILLTVGVMALVAQLAYFKLTAPLNQDEPFLEADFGKADMSARVDDYPATFIEEVHVSLTGPSHEVHLKWAGPNAASQKLGPFRSSPGIGIGGDCNDFEESRKMNSCCTPKGEWKVVGFNDFLSSVRHCHHVTWFHLPREIALHSHPDVPPYAASHGCVRLEPYVAQLIHNNTIAGKTVVRIDGTWQRPPESSLRRSVAVSDIDDKS